MKEKTLEPIRTNLFKANFELNIEGQEILTDATISLQYYIDSVSIELYNYVGVEKVLFSIDNNKKFNIKLSQLDNSGKVFKEIYLIGCLIENYRDLFLYKLDYKVENNYNILNLMITYDTLEMEFME